MCVLIIDVLKYLVWKNKCYENQIWFKCYLSSVHEEKFPYCWLLFSLGRCRYWNWIFMPICIKYQQQTYFRKKYEQFDYSASLILVHGLTMRNYTIYSKKQLKSYFTGLSVYLWLRKKHDYWTKLLIRFVSRECLCYSCA